MFGYPVNEFAYQQIKLKHIPAGEFEKKAADNPLAAAYLPLTDYPKKDRPLIRAKAIKGIAGVEGGPRRSVLYSLIDHGLQLEPAGEKTFREIIQENPMFQEAKMLQSIEELGMEKGMEFSPRHFPILQGPRRHHADGAAFVGCDGDVGGVERVNAASSRSISQSGNTRTAG